MKHPINPFCRVSAAMLTIVLGALGVMFCVVPVHAASATASATPAFPGMMTLHDGKLTAQLTAVPLGQVMAEVSRLSGAQVLWLGAVEQQASVSVGFTDLPLSEALERLLGENNFLLFYTAAEEDMRLTQIWVSAKGLDTRPILLPPSPSTTLDAPSSPSPDAAFASEETTESIIQTALHDPDAMIRVLTVSKLGMRAQEDVWAKAIIAQMAVSDSDPSVRSVAAEMLDSLEEQEPEQGK